jgi:hypothetical protein
MAAQDLRGVKAQFFFEVPAQLMPYSILVVILIAMAKALFSLNNRPSRGSFSQLLDPSLPRIRRRHSS